MHNREHLVRALWTLFEPIHAVTYFASQAREHFAAVGLTRYWDGYFAGRAAPLGAVRAAPVTAMFSGFAPALVERALPAAWSVASVERVLEARSLGAAQTLRELVPDEGLVTDAAAALTRISDRVDTIGRPLAAANRALPEEADPYRQLWQATATLREHRGDGHVLALVCENIAGLSTIVLRSSLDLDPAAMKRGRGWTEEQWNAEVEALCERRLLTAHDAISPLGTAALNRAEGLTNRLALEPWNGLDDTAVADVARLLSPIALACGAVLPLPNPIGMPQPWDPDVEPQAAAMPVAPD
ncbi:SCO6745 family protein [Cryobacterium psychrophilum]|uniref:Uncharacterized protein n=1 Tax=Cryobacterium psychrophilum TaxID=41988 RepID=A0A4Y8KTB4_9MICO|nr:hypothetical protein [Cryobacterium psychrophilum]TDW29588.1 hypothetical protein EDD25_1298 [Cryobacterium psychrophilum]TFD81718.1 hypothetical protein E3T53_01575 [Cryobacterium psychrophilum]